jgi:hypothetical protein
MDATDATTSVSSMLPGTNYFAVKAIFFADLPFYHPALLDIFRRPNGEISKYERYCHPHSRTQRIDVENSHVSKL